MTHARPLTIGERIIVHLSQYGRYQDAYVVPPGMSQGGISETLGITRAHAAIELRRQMDAGRVEVRMAHVTGVGPRRKVYHLTPHGVGLARAVRDRALRRTVELIRPEGTIEAMPGPGALDELRRHGVPEARGVLMLLTFGRIDLRRPDLREMRIPRASELAPGFGGRAAGTWSYPAVPWEIEAVLGPPHVPRAHVAA